jgi:DnaK suppressor protein
MMDETTRARLRVQLEQELARLEADLAELDTGERDSQPEATGENAYRDHMADQGSATFAREMDMTFEENERGELEDVRAAIKRLDAGTYGNCERCGCAIPVNRLEAVPAANMCIQCKEAEETR